MIDNKLRNKSRKFHRKMTLHAPPRAARKVATRGHAQQQQARAVHAPLLLSDGNCYKKLKMLYLGHFSSVSPII